MAKTTPCADCGRPLLKAGTPPLCPGCARVRETSDDFALEAPKLREADVLKQATGFLTLRGWEVRRMFPGTWVPYHEHRRHAEALADGREPEYKPIPRTLHPNNDPDLLCVHPVFGVLWLEIKAPGKKPRREQERRINLLRSSGFRAWWVDSLTELETVYDRADLK